MKYYSFSTKGYYTSEIHGENIPSDALEMTDEVYDQVFEAHCRGYVLEACDINGVKAVPPPAKTKEEKAADVRFKRNNLLDDLDKRVNNPLRWDAYSDAYKAALTKYRQDLLDVPQQDGFPDNVVIPKAPKE